MSVQSSDFDTEVLKVPVGKLSGPVRDLAHLKTILAEAQQLKLQCIFWAARDADVGGSLDQFLQHTRPEGMTVNTKATFKVGLGKSLIAALSQRKGVENVDVCEFKGKEPTSELTSLSLLSGGHSRFATDAKLSSDQYNNMFTVWMKNSVNHQVADVVFVAYVTRDGAEHTAGMLTARIRHGVSSIELLAVSENFQRLGVGVALVIKAFSWSMSKSVSTMKVATQFRNEAAIALYKICGFELEDTIHDAHFWLSHGTVDEFAHTEIPNSLPFLGAKEMENLQALFASRDIRTHAKYGTACEELLTEVLGTQKTLLVGSGTQALELCSLLVHTTGPENKGEYEVIVPSYTFVSTANAFVIHGAKPVFVDIRRDTQNIDETKIEAAIKPGITRAIVCVHYAGVPCEMDTIMTIARKHNVLVIEDNAHGIFSTYKGKRLGTIGDLGAFSFHYTKNMTCGEGGAVTVNKPDLVGPAMIIYEKGTNRFDFLQGRISKYAWVSKGGSFPMSEIAAAVLLGQLNIRDEIQASRQRTWTRYHAGLEDLEKAGKLRRPVIPEGCEHNAHIYYFRAPAKSDFDEVAAVSKKRKVSIFTHYEPLHSSAGGQKLGRTSGDCVEADLCGQQLYRLPIWVGLTDQEIDRVLDVVFEAFNERPSKRAHTQ